METVQDNVQLGKQISFEIQIQVLNLRKCDSLCSSGELIRTNLSVVTKNQLHVELFIFFILIFMLIRKNILCALGTLYLFLLCVYYISVKLLSTLSCKNYQENF